MALNVLCKLTDKFPRLRLIIVPRHPERFAEVAKILENSGQPWQRRSEISAHETQKHTKILLVDTIGELGAFWGLAKIGFVGGSMGTRGGQNMIEAAAYGSAVCFGPNTWNFKDIVTAMLAQNAAVVVRDGEEMTAFVRRCLTDTSFSAELQENATRLIRSGQGAAKKTVDFIGGIWSDRSS